MAPDVRWGIAGFGEVGTTMAAQLVLAGPVTVADPRLSGGSVPPVLARRVADLDVHVAPDTRTLAQQCDILISTVTPAAAREAAEAAASADRVLFVDFNSISPSEKQALAGLFAGGRYVDGAILGSIAAEGARTPLALSGERAEDVCRALEAVGFRVEVAGPAVGAASALKMCRSIFMKGIECLFVETVLAAAQFDITEPVLQSVEETFRSLGFQGTVRMLLTTHAVHCERRADEMARVTAMLEEMCLPHAMSAASHETLNRSARSGLTEHVRGSVPTNPEITIDYLATFYRKECA